MKIETILITPALAEVLLKNNKSNRKISLRNLNFIVDSMNKGIYKEDTGEAIKISKTGNLLDGQHRLLSIVKTGKSYNMLVISELEDEVFSVLDTGKSRSGADVLAMKGYPSGVGLAVAVRHILLMKQSTVHFKNPSPSNEEIRKFVEANEEIVEIFQFCNNVYRKFKHITPGVLTAIYWTLQSKGNTVANIDKFFDSYSKGIDLKEDDPIYALRYKFIKDTGNKTRLSMQDRCNLFINAWNAWIKGRKLSNIRLSDTFPTAL